MIPPLVSYKNLESFEQSIRYHYESDKSPVAAAKAEAAVNQARILVSKGLPPIPNPTTLALILGVSPKLISSMALKPARYWKIFYLPKRTGGVRVITAPRVFLKSVQYYILQNILSRGDVAPESFGFSPRKSIFRNAAVHVGKKWIWNTDLEDFFPTITHQKVREVFGSLGFTRNMSIVLASLCTHSGRLPQGAPTSPMLSNVIFRKTDAELVVVASKFGITYSRYADDLTFSSDEQPTIDFISEIDQVISAAGFRRSMAKTRLHGPNGPKYVTGLVVNEKVHPDRRTRRLLRAKFHRLQTVKPSEKSDLHKLHGWAAYVNAYDPNLGAKYLAQIREQIAISNDAAKEI